MKWKLSHIQLYNFCHKKRINTFSFEDTELLASRKPVVSGCMARESFSIHRETWIRIRVWGNLEKREIKIKSKLSLF